MVAHAFSTFWKQKEADLCEFKGSLVYIEFQASQSSMHLIYVE